MTRDLVARPRGPRALPALGLAALVVAPTAARAQSVLERPPDLAGAWVGSPGTVYFNFLHRFTSSDAPERKVTAIPTFLLAGGLPWRTLVGVHYSSNSTVAPRYPNEWELFARWQPLDQERGALASVGVQGGYNVAAQSVDGELTLARRLGRVKVMGGGRVLSNAFDAGDVRYGVVAGALVRLHRYIALAGDVGSLVDREDGERVAWSGALQLGIPFTPHTLSLHAANTTTATLQGLSVGTGETWYGFEFTIPITLSRYIGTRRGESPPPVAAAPAAPAAPAAASDTAAVAMSSLKFAPATIEVPVGATVAWRNDDPVAHTVTAADGSWDSGLMQPGQRWSRTFDRPGTYAYTCTPHPFMRGVVVVRER